jgi:MEKHLA domain
MIAEPGTDERDTVMTPIWMQAAVIAWSQHLLDSYAHWTGANLLSRDGTVTEQAKRLFCASFVLVSHGTEPDPVLNYGNEVGLALWEMTWEQFVRTPSSQTAEPVNRAERADLLRTVTERGYCDRYRGIRISATGRRFLVEGARVWNVIDAEGERIGQAAAFSQWTMLQ